MRRIACALLLFGIAALASCGEPAEHREIFARLAGRDDGERQDAFREIRSNRDEVVRALIAIVEKADGADPSEAQSKAKAAELLGIFRAPEACDVLLKNVAFICEAIVEEPSRLEPYPCGKALRNIGKPAVDKILASLLREWTDVELAVLATVIYEVEGKEWGLQRVEKASLGLTGRALDRVAKMWEVIDKRH